MIEVPPGVEGTGGGFLARLSAILARWRDPLQAIAAIIGIGFALVPIASALWGRIKRGFLATFSRDGDAIVVEQEPVNSLSVEAPQVISSKDEDGGKETTKSLPAEALATILSLYENGREMMGDDFTMEAQQRGRVEEKVFP